MKTFSAFSFFYKKKKKKKKKKKSLHTYLSCIKAKSSYKISKNKNFFGGPKIGLALKGLM